MDRYAARYRIEGEDFERFFEVRGVDRFRVESRNICALVICRVVEVVELEVFGVEDELAGLGVRNRDVAVVAAACVIDKWADEGRIGAGVELAEGGGDSRQRGNAITEAGGPIRA